MGLKKDIKELEIRMDKIEKSSDKILAELKKLCTKLEHINNKVIQRINN